MARETGLITCRHVLWYLVFSGTIILYMLRISLNLIIVAMVIPHPKSAAAAECVNDEINVRSNDSTMTTNVTTSPLTVEYKDRFDWNEYDQNLALGAYYWTNALTQIPGGILARRYGAKLTFGWANLSVAFFGFLVPMAAHYHLYAFVFIRTIQGFLAGVAWPALHELAAKWIPPDERSKFISAYMGNSVGTALTYPLCGAIINAFGWEAAFYFTSLLAIIWYCFWFFLVYDTPRQHPRISKQERDYILEKIASSTADRENSKIPWKAILTSGPVWIATASLWGYNWGFFTLITQAPSYFNYVHGWDIQAASLFSGLPHMARMGFSWTFSFLSDWLLRTKRMSRTNVRKLGTFMCTGGQGLLVLALGMSGCHPILAIVFMITGTASSGAIAAGTFANLVDMSPNYAGVLMGIGGLVGVVAGFISPVIVGILTNNNQSIRQWRLVFVIAALNMGCSCVIFTFFGTSDLQPWNSYGKADEEVTGEELQSLQTKVENGENVDNVIRQTKQKALKNANQ